MKIAFYDTHKFERVIFDKSFEKSAHKIVYLEPRLGPLSAVLSRGFDIVCSFANDCLDAETLQILKNNETKLIALRCAGFNQVDLAKAKELAIPIVRVPAYSPYAVAEHAVALLMTINRKIHKSFARVRELNFSLEGLVGFDVHGKTVGILGTGRIGSAVANIFRGFGCKVLAFDEFPNKELASTVEYVGLKDLIAQSDIISLHLPLTPKTKHIINHEAFELMKDGAILLNTGRGALIETQALINALKTKKLGGAGLDVYELEEGVFFNDMSECGITDDLLARLLTFPNVVVTSHQAFLTKEALQNIADQTLANIDAFSQGQIINKVG